VKLPQLTPGAEIIELRYTELGRSGSGIGRRSSQAACGLPFVAAIDESREPHRNHDSVEAGAGRALRHRLAGASTAMTPSREVE
jgi:hypothetical protein